MSPELIKSFVDTANNRECDFPLNNLPFGVCFEKGKQQKQKGDQSLQKVKEMSQGMKKWVSIWEKVRRTFSDASTGSKDKVSNNAGS